MNVLPARVEGSSAFVGPHEISLGRGFESISSGKVEIGVRPEFTTLSTGAGLPVEIVRIEDVGRHRIVRTAFEGTEINVIQAEGMPIATDAKHLSFAPEAVHVYVDGWIRSSERAA